MPTTKSFNCLTCNIEFDSPSGLSQHVALVHLECAVCGEIFSSPEQLDRHTRQEH